MRKEYDFSKAVKNPYAKALRKQVTIRLDVATVEYFKLLAAEFDIPYQNLINFFLRECAVEQKRPSFSWESKKEPKPVRTPRARSR